MSKLFTFVSGTIVLIFISPGIWAKPLPEAPPESEVEDVWPDAEPHENLSIANPPPLNGPAPEIQARYYPYRQALTLRMGQHSRFPDVDFDEWVLGFQYLFPKFLSPKLEAGADLQEHGLGHLHAGVRWYWWERSYFRPSVKVAFDHLAESKENLATLTRVRNYYVRNSATLEYVTWNPYSVRLEVELLAGLANQRLVVTLGLSRGW